VPRQSAESLAAEIVALPAAKLEPPDDITPEQAAIWRGITARLPAEWFSSDNTPVLRELCRHVSYARRIAEELDEVRDRKGPADRKLFLQLARAHALQSNRIADLSTRLRLTNQSVSRDKTATLRKNEPSGALPWRDWGDDAGTN